MHVALLTQKSLLSLLVNVANLCDQPAHEQNHQNCGERLHRHMKFQIVRIPI